MSQPAQDNFAGFLQLAAVEVIGTVDDVGLALGAVDGGFDEGLGYITEMSATLAAATQGEEGDLYAIG